MHHTMRPILPTTPTTPTTRRLVHLAAALSLGVLPVAHADSGNLQPRVTLPAYQQECAACHMAYPQACCQPSPGPE